MNKRGSPPYCEHCGCVVPREGIYCQSCRSSYGYESADCVCYEDSPDNCASKLKHYCCCTVTFDTEDCKAPEHKHDCICPEDNCLALEHE
jgi:hypothetical protein